MSQALDALTRSLLHAAEKAGADEINDVMMPCLPYSKPLLSLIQSTFPGRPKSDSP